MSVWRDEDSWTYFVGAQPVYRHRASDLRLFRLTIAQLIDSGACRPCEIIRTFGIAKSHVDRATRLYRDSGAEGFFTDRSRKKPKSRGTVMTAEVLAQAQALLADGMSKPAAAAQLGVPYATFRRAVWDGRLREGPAVPPPPDKSRRSVEDAEAAEILGTGCTRVGERVMAALGQLNGAATRFQLCRDVPFGGVLCALGALLSNGLLNGLEKSLGRIQGYYTATQVLLLLAFMALCRVKSVEQLRGKAPGELGKLMGLDRVPEVRCLRKKIDALAAGQGAEKWAAELSREWMEADPDMVGTLYIDGHVRVYHGSKNKLPRRYVSRQRLCLRGCTDYWVNDWTGRPFFFIDKPVDPGLIQVLRNDIVPRLLQDVPAQPGEEELAADPHLCRFVLVFDREGYSPGFFQKMWNDHRIACITYHKHPVGKWSESEFVERGVTLSNGEEVKMKLAERGSLIGSGKDAIWLKEIRKLDSLGKQISLVGTGYGLEPAHLAARLFSRWCQENFFRYMMQHYAIDLLNQYGSEPLHDTEKVVNPAWRELDRQRNRLKSTLVRRNARFAELTLHPISKDKDSPEKHQKWEVEKGALLVEIAGLNKELKAIKTQLNETARHLLWKDLDEEDRFTKPPPARKRLLDTVRMIAYRAETALCSLLREQQVDSAAARRILQDLFATEADLVPDEHGKTLTIKVHRSTRPAVDRTLEALFAKLNELKYTFPATDLVIRYELLGSPAKKPAESVTEASQR